VSGAGAADLVLLRATRERVRSVAYGLLAGALSAVPAVLRMSGADGSPGGLVVASACALPIAFAVPVVLGARQARSPEVPAPGHGARPSALRVAAVAAGLALPVLSLLGGWLFSGTHHRPLGAVTFACAALIVLAGCAVLARRLVTLGRRGPLLAALVLAGAAALLLVGRGIAEALARGGSFIDGLLWLGLVIGASLLPSGAESGRASSEARSGHDVGRARSVLRAGLLLWLVTCAVGVLGLGLDAASLARWAPAFTWPLR